MQQNPASLESRYLPLSIQQRTYGMNKVAEIKSKKLGLSNQELESFIKEMRNRFNDDFENNKKLLGVIFYIAGINKSRFSCQFEELTTSEIFNIVKAINYIKAASALLPKNLTLPIN
ncbi:DUF5347 family protein [Moellerella wisconsensis]|uniref:DUF5347 family protein n=1 Tax=Moellerella wisconsensis TaxID=158849 RepID=UPI0030761136